MSGHFHSWLRTFRHGLAHGIQTSNALSVFFAQATFHFISKIGVGSTDIGIFIRDIATISMIPRTRDFYAI